MGRAVGQPLVTPTPAGYGAGELAQAYGLTGSAGQTGTVAIITAGAYPTLESDLYIYRSAFGLPVCVAASGCLRVVSYQGGAAPTPARSIDGTAAEENLALETSTDVDMASAACPKCHLLVIELPWFGAGQYVSDKVTHLVMDRMAAAVQTAHHLGADTASISYGYPSDGYSNNAVIRTKMTVRGMAVIASSGDEGFDGTAASWPQNLPSVVSVGGTSLYSDPGGGRGFTEVGWDGSGSSCTTGLGPAAGQPASVAAHCAGHRAASDISAVADPATGVAVYDSYAPSTGEPNGFFVQGGTSVSAPLIAGMYARAGVPADTIGPNQLYRAPRSATSRSGRTRSPAGARGPAL